jgi:hypothetical protein
LNTAKDRKPGWRVWLMAASLVGALPDGSIAAEYAAAFLEVGVGARGVGMGNAFVAAVDDATASYWNPAGLLRSKGKELTTSVQPMSLDRRQSSFSARLNLRGELAFGFSWVHARVGDIVGRSSSGIPTGDLRDSQNAYHVAVARQLHPRLTAGGILKVLEHEIVVPGRGGSKGRGHGFDFGVQFRAFETTYVGATARNVNSELSWKVKRSSQQSTTTDDPLPRVVAIGIAHQPVDRAVVAVDVHLGNKNYLNLGAEWEVSPVLTVRGGVSRLPGDDIAVGSIAAGLTLRPMRTETVQFYYTYATDDLDAGGRTVAGVGVTF